MIDAELLDDGEDLAGEGLVDLDEIDVLERHAGALERDLRRRNGADAHDLGIAADDAPADDAAERLFRLGVFSCSNRYYSCAVDDPAGVAGGDEAVLGEGGLELGQSFHGGLGAEVIVLRDLLALAADRNGHDLLAQAAGFLRRSGAPLALQREGVLLFA